MYLFLVPDISVTGIYFFLLPEPLAYNGMFSQRSPVPLPHFPLPAFPHPCCPHLSPYFSPHTRVSGLGQTLTDEKWHVSSNLTCPIAQLTPGEAGRLEWDIVCQSLHLTEGEVGVAMSVFTFPGLAVTCCCPSG